MYVFDLVGNLKREEKDKNGRREEDLYTTYNKAFCSDRKVLFYLVQSPVHLAAPRPCHSSACRILDLLIDRTYMNIRMTYIIKAAKKGMEERKERDIGTSSPSCTHATNFGTGM